MRTRKRHHASTNISTRSTRARNRSKAANQLFSAQPTKRTSSDAKMDKKEHYSSRAASKRSRTNDTEDDENLATIASSNGALWNVFDLTAVQDRGFYAHLWTSFRLQTETLYVEDP